MKDIIKVVALELIANLAGGLATAFTVTHKTVAGFALYEGEKLGKILERQRQAYVAPPVRKEAN